MAVSPLKIVLNDIARIEGVRLVVVASKDGFIIDSVASGGEPPVDPEALAAVASALYNTTMRLAGELKANSMEDVIVEFDNAYTVLQDVGEAIVAIVASKPASLGMLRYELRRQRDRIKSAL